MQPQLSDAEVIKRARQVWAAVQSGKIEPWIGRKATARTEKTEINLLCGKGRNGSDALTLLLMLRVEHGARCARGETFCIAADAMQREQTIPGWHAKRIVAARDLLLKEGKIEKVAERRKVHSGWMPARYTLVRRSAQR